MLEADLGATVVQSCVVTLDPVTTRVEETALRRYTPDIEAAEAEASGVSPGVARGGKCRRGGWR